MASTSLKDIDIVYDDLRNGFRSGKLKSINYRKQQLLQLAHLINDNSPRFEEALQIDLGRPSLETQFGEIGIAITEALTAYRNVEKWSKPEHPPFSLNFAAMRPVIRKEPKGLVLIITPFNYPVFLSFSPVAAAIAAGNCVLLKPSEQSAATSALMAELAPKYLDPDIFRVINGAIPETTRLLELRWDHIMYTGSQRTAKIVAAAAAKHLTPVSLELGGKSPVIIDTNCDLAAATRRILWGKCVNAGQACISPDYVLVPRDFQDEFVKALTEQLDKFYPPTSPASAEGNFARLVSPAAFSRVSGLLKSTKGTVVIGGETDERERYIAPTIVRDVRGDDSLMSEEIFGPVLPIVPVKDVDEAIAFVNARDHPLALYVFSQDSKFKKKVFDNTTSGAAVANETMMHIAADGLPFGGIGPSGHGYHTGKFGFDAFTHLRASMDSPSWLDRIIGVRFPPYTAKNKATIMKLFSPRLPPRPTNASSGTVTNLLRKSGMSGMGKWFFLALALVVVRVLMTRGSVLLPGI